jgi:hypothetical protein
MQKERADERTERATQWDAAGVIEEQSAGFRAARKVFDHGYA